MTRSHRPPTRILGIDFGATFTDAVLLERGRLIFAYSRRRESFREQALYRNLEKQKLDFDAIAVTGRNQPLSRPCLRVHELDAIGRGGLFLAQKKKGLVVSAGTGTAIVFAAPAENTHEIGTGVGGGTLEGLSRHLLGTTLFSAHRLALQGTPDLDLSVGEVVGGPLAGLPKNATASNFGKASKKPRRRALAYSIFNLVSETIGVLACSAARRHRLPIAFFIGRTSSLSFVRQRIKTTCALFFVRPVFLKNPELATAIGAALFFSDRRHQKTRSFRARV